MKCPHCLISFHDDQERKSIDTDSNFRWTLVKRTCPECGRFILSFIQEYGLNDRGNYTQSKEFFCYPKAESRSPLPKEVPNKYANDYKEACLTLADSPKASSALSRRCLQYILRDEAKIKPGNLSDEIQQVLDEKKLPNYLLKSLDAIRNIGNFAAHPIKSKSSGEIIDVEPGEAEWNLDVLESLFDYYFVRPAVLKKKKDKLNVKLKKAGKPPMKEP
ncbi:DUF4145 domain-containing protein [candidate division WOR-3 bacterium]|nr:DUF4145 domain-containing protein [candidate division WOR-3 bacterium]